MQGRPTFAYTAHQPRCMCGVLLMRDDFPAPVKRLLAERAGYRCSNPDCRRLTIGPASIPIGSVSIGEAAHITAAAPPARRQPTSGAPCSPPGDTAQRPAAPSPTAATTRSAPAGQPRTQKLSSAAQRATTMRQWSMALRRTSRAYQLRRAFRIAPPHTHGAGGATRAPPVGRPETTAGAGSCRS